MQGRKDFTPKLFYELSLDRLVPKEDFYRKVNQYLDLHFLYKATEKYYGSEGQQSIDPVVFFKILLVGYLNNINSDRALLRYCSDSLSVRLFLGYDLDSDFGFAIQRTIDSLKINPKFNDIKNEVYTERYIEIEDCRSCPKSIDRDSIYYGLILTATNKKIKIITNVQSISYIPIIEEYFK